MCFCMEVFHANFPVLMFLCMNSQVKQIFQSIESAISNEGYPVMGQVQFVQLLQTIKYIALQAFQLLVTQIQ